MQTAVERFWPKVEQGTGCWEWKASRNWGGYGQFWNGQRTMPAHRFAYELLVGPIPEGLQIDHLCRNRGCVNPTHMEVVTNQENSRRGKALITHCPQGHPYAGHNLAIQEGRRRCRRCLHNRRKARRKRARARARELR